MLHTLRMPPELEIGDVFMRAGCFLAHVLSPCLRSNSSWQPLNAYWMSCTQEAAVKEVATDIHMDVDVHEKLGDGASGGDCLSPRDSGNVNTGREQLSDTTSLAPSPPAALSPEPVSQPTHPLSPEPGVCGALDEADRDRRAPGDEGGSGNLANSPVESSMSAAEIDEANDQFDFTTLFV